MKKLFVTLILLLFSVSTYAELSGYYNAGKTKVSEIKESFVGNENCPVYADTPLSKVSRPAWELEVGINAGMFPSNGAPQFRTDSFSGEVVHNLSNAFGVYAKYDSILYDKYNYVNSEYEPEWNNYLVSVGVHLYVTPVIRGFVGAGKMYAKDSEGNKPSLGTAFERGVKYDIALKGYKIVLVYKNVEAELSEEEPNITESSGSQTYSVFGISLSVPLGN